MKIGIIGAMEIEVAQLKSMIENVTEEEISSVVYYKGKIHNKDIVLAKCGVGKVNAAVCTQTMILKFSPDIIINTGVAGSLNSKLDISDIVISDYVVQHDMDTTAIGDPKGFISGINIIKIPSPNSLIQKIYNAANNIKETHTYIGTIASGDQFISSEEQKKPISDNFNAMCTEMEGAAIGQVCYLNKTDFCIIRSISDKADGTAHMDFSSFANIAAKKSTQLIDNFLKEL